MAHAFAAIVASAVAAFATISSPVLAETVLVDFETMALDQPPEGFMTATTGDGPEGQWLVREEADAPSGSRVLAQVSAEPRRPQFPVAVHDGISAADVELSVQFKPISGAVDQAAGLVWRYQDENNYYIVRANALEGNVVLYKVAGGERTDLPLVGEGRTYGAEAEVPSNVWSTLGIRAEGSRFTVSLNGSELFSVEDETFAGPGSVGLWTKADSVTAFDDLRIATLE